MADFASKIPLTMPLSAKKKQKYHLFSPSVSCSRLRRVQSLLKADDLDGVLCILGIDSRYNSGTKQLLNYLLFGFCNVSADSISARLTDEALEDVVVFVKPTSVHVYCNPINYNYLLPYIAHWRNLHLHCLAKDEDDEEKAEEFKILSFISMVKDCNKIGIPYGHDSTQKSFDAFVVEKWPLIQAFALEGFEGGGFFTMVHEVVDVTSSLNDVYGTVDPVIVEQLITKRLPLFERHCKAVLANVDVESGTWESLSKITESLVGEPVMSYYKHGRMSDSPALHSNDADKPFVMFGVNTIKESLDKAMKGTLSNKNTTLSTTGVAGSTSRHMVCCARDPKGTISCIRTYFFGNGFLPSADESILDSTKTAQQSKDLRLLIDLYLLVIDALLDGIKGFALTQDITQAKSAVDACIKSGLTKKALSIDAKKVKFSIEAHDFLGRKVSLETNKYVPCLKMASLLFYDIPSIERPGSILGSVAFGETFLDSAVKILDQGNEGLWNAQYVIITENISRFTSWQGGDERLRQLENFAKSNSESTLLGKKLVHGDVCVFAGQSLYSIYEEGILYVYEKGFIFVHPRFGPVILPLNVLATMQFYDKESSSSAALIILNYLPSLAQYLPPYLVNHNNRIVLALLPRTKVFRLFYSEVLHLWKAEDSKPVLELTSELPEDLMTIYSYIKENNASTHPSTIQHAMKTMPQLKSFLPHMIMSSTSNIPIQSQDISLLTGDSSLVNKHSEENNNLELLLTILIGVPGSGKDHLCNTLMALAKENSKWIVLKSPLNSTQPFDPKVLQVSLSNTVTSQKKLLVRMSSGRKQVRVILVTPGFTDIIDIVQAIYSHPKPEAKNHVKIGAVTCCIDPENMFMEERYTLPKVLEQCAQGWVNNVVFTSCLDPQNEQLAMVQKLVRACNPDAAFILAKGGEVTRSSDVELILSDNTFTNEKAMQKKHLMCPGWSLGVFNSGPCEPEINEICINLFGPLDKTLFVSRLRALHGHLNLKDCQTTSTIYSIRGHVHFVDHNTITEVHWTRLKGSHTMNTVDVSAIPRPPPKATQNGSIDENISSYFIIFTGFSLQQDALKDWLRSCCRPKPQKKPFKSLKDLTKKELDQITAKHKCDPLPEGWFYNGTTYVNLTGEKSIQHPLMDNFIKEHLTGINEAITKHNASIAISPDVDIFKKQ